MKLKNINIIFLIFILAFFVSCSSNKNIKNFEKSIVDSDLFEETFYNEPLENINKNKEVVVSENDLEEKFDIELYKNEKINKDSENQKTIALFIYDINNDFIPSLASLLKSSLNINDYKLFFVNCKKDINYENDMIKKFIDNNISALIIDPGEDNNIQTVVNTIKGSQIPSIFINVQPNLEHTKNIDNMCFVSLNKNNAATLQSEIIYDIDGHSDINKDNSIKCFVLSDEKSKNDKNPIYLSVVENLKSKGIKLEVLDIKYAEEKNMSAESVLANFLAKNGSEVELILCNNPVLTYATIQPILAFNKKPGKDIFVVGIGANKYIIDEINNSTINGVLYEDVSKLAYSVYSTLDSYFSNGKFENKNNFYDYVKINNENVKNYISE